jgi:hypothetical protein
MDENSPENIERIEGTPDTESRALGPSSSLDAAPAVPSGELPPAEPALFEQAKAALSAIRGRGRRPNGQAGPGNTLNLRSGLRSRQLLDVPDVRAWHCSEVAAIEADLGGPESLSALQKAAVHEVARVRLILASLGENLFEHGVLTTKGKTRAATATYLQVFDRFVRGVTLLGLERQARRLDLAERLAALHQSPSTPEEPPA